MKIFISYPSEQEDRAREVYTFCKQCGLDAFFDKESIVAGLDWDRAIKTAQSQADLTILIFSPETAAKSGVIQREVKEALRRMEDRPFGDIYLIVLRTEAAALPPELQDWQYIDFSRSDWRLRLAQSFQMKSGQMNVEILGVERFLASLGEDIRTAHSVHIDTKKYKQAVDFFTYANTGPYWQYVNAEIMAEAYRGIYQQKHFAQSWERDIEWSLSVKEFYREDDALSLQLFHYSDAGGAHPNHGVSTMNFGGDDIGKFGITEILSTDEATLKYITKYCELDARRQFLEPEGGESPIDFAEYVERHYWKLFDQFNFDKNGLVINFSPYDILPHVYGSFDIRIPWEQLRGKINQDFVVCKLAKSLGLLDSANVY